FFDDPVADSGITRVDSKYYHTFGLVNEQAISVPIYNLQIAIYKLLRTESKCMDIVLLFQNTNPSAICKLQVANRKLAYIQYDTPE
ncbi:MAG: hypothetical protein FWD58_09465, partial [Firmicutes bacterium]|nr:hypothetical protein [Bacillota bacterium]